MRIRFERIDDVRIRVRWICVERIRIESMGVGII